MSRFIYTVEVYNNKTLKSEVLAYTTNLSEKRMEALRTHFDELLTDDEDYSLRFNIFNDGFDNIEIVMEALNFVRE